MELDPQSHTYKYQNDTYTSVTTLVHRCFQEFDADLILKRMKILPGSKYYGMTKEEIKQLWQANAVDAQCKGTLMHSIIERYYKKESITEEETQLPEIVYFMEFTKKFQLIPYGIELCIFSKTIKLAGTIDFVAQNTDGTLDIYDWKRSNHIELNNPYNKYSHVVAHIPDTNFWHYTLQLNLYKYLLETEYDKKVNKMFLVSFHPSNMSYFKYEVSNIQPYIPLFLEKLTLKHTS